MTEENRTYRVFISAGEASGDSHCAGLIKAVKKVNSNIEFVGVGGPKMQQEGCELLKATCGEAAMIYNAFRQVPHYIRLIMRIAGYLKKNKVDLVIVCDSPAFNFHIAKAAKKAGIKTLFYVAPQLWAWAQWRIKKLRKYCDKLCCILPFEEDWFRSRGIDVTFVGNPLLDELDADIKNNKKNYSQFEVKNLKLALMPGSRPAEIEALWRPMQKIAVRLKKKYHNIEIIAVAVNEETKEVLKANHTLGFRCRYNIGSVIDTAKEVDFALVASGSATLQVAAAGCPMVIMYQSNKLLWHLLGRWLVKTKYLSLVNILKEQELVPEFMPYFDSIEPIIETIESRLKDGHKLGALSFQLVKLAAEQKLTNAAEKTADIVKEMLEKVPSVENK
ncbi:MAG: lipid-A-disaccharide synthase [Planctomycetota bacterium]|jgi:lipid-A-disaccharide synthase